MNELVSTLRIIDEGNKYVLEGKNREGNNSEILLTPDDVLILAKSTQAYEGRILEERKTPGQTAPLVVTNDDVKISVSIAPLTEKVILTMVSDFGDLAYSIGLEKARKLLPLIRTAIEQIEAGRLPRQ